MGIIFLPVQIIRSVIAWLIFSYAAAASAQAIELPEPPRAAPPPLDPDYYDPDTGDALDRREFDLRQKREDRKKRDRDLEKPQPTPDDKKAKALAAEAVLPRPERFLFAANLIAPMISTSGGQRKSYTAEITGEFNGLWRPSEDKTERWRPWIGGHLGAFTGAGKQESTVGRYGFTYFGPIVGVGKFDLAPASLTGEASSDAGGSEVKLTRSGYLLAVGAMMVSKRSYVPGGNDDAASDFEDTNARFESGVYGEAMFFKIKYGALCYQLVVGGQTAVGKSFIWFGGGMGGIY
jgi:hypothetical protein